MQIQNKIHSDHTNFQQYLTNPSKVEFIVRPVEPDEVCKLISSFKINKALGPNSVPQQILSLVKNEISEPLTTLINMSFSSGVYPSKLKIAEIIPVHKSGSKLEVNNYRPISLLSNINNSLTQYPKDYLTLLFLYEIYTITTRGLLVKAL